MCDCARKKVVENTCSVCNARSAVSDQRVWVQVSVMILSALFQQLCSLCLFWEPSSLPVWCYLPRQGCLWWRCSLSVLYRPVRERVLFCPLLRTTFSRHHTVTGLSVLKSPSVEVSDLLGTGMMREDLKVRGHHLILSTSEPSGPVFVNWKAASVGLQGMCLCSEYQTLHQRC